ncbi:sugar kinase [Vibrio splendidus]|uniref:sugar kinase n=1 Tax=Vibrio splendidus TaxID=29497 RepID=UPI000EC8C621|nr:sugar kinase [Vibrio splendidus]MDH5886172.1 sugar kinase [Vibrio splendidus]RIH72764.1 ribokinase [Vibrio splendidus]URM15589.1 sugar kinase [Vibrio splendidus]
MKIACLGITVLDRVQLVEKLPTTGGKYVSKDYFEIGGGPAATAAVAVSKLGHEVEFVGRVGSDSVANTMIEELNSYGVKTNHIVHINNASSSFSSVLVDDEGERMIINHQDPMLNRDISVLQDVDFSQFDAVLCDVRWPEGAKYLLGKAKEHGIPSVLDADLSPDPIDELVKLADHVAFSEEGLSTFVQNSEVEAGLRLAKQETSGKVYVTVGKHGCYWLENNELQHEAAPVIDVVDTTGAGDTFHGALVVAVAEKIETRAAVKFSNIVAAIKCTKLGGREGIPTRSTVNKHINE